MSIDWDDYVLYDPGVAGSLSSLPRTEARQVFKRCMETKAARVEMLRRLLRANGVELGTEDAAIQDLNDWFYAKVDADPEQPGGPLPGWYSVIHDVALFLGEVIIERHPHLHWEFFTWGKANVAFQRHVIMGLSTEGPKFHTNINIDRMVANYAHQIIESRGSTPSYGTIDVRGSAIDVDAAAARHRGREIETDAFWRWLQMVEQRA
jgi:hypothetical protein